MEEVTKGRGGTTIFTTNEWSRTAPDGAIAALYMAALFVYEGLVLAQTLADTEKGAHSAAHPGLAKPSGRLSALGTSGWRGALSAEGVKSSVQLPPKDAPLAPVGPFLSIRNFPSCFDVRCGEACQ